MRENELHQISDACANAIVHSLREPLVLLDSAMNIKLANPAFREKFGVTAEDTFGLSVYQLGNRDWNTPALADLLAEVVRTKGAFHDFQIEQDLPHIGKRILLLSGQLIGDGDTDAKLILLSVTDATERLLMEHTLGVSELRYRRLFEAAHDGILILNASTCQIEDVNPFIQELLEYPRAHFIGKELWEIGIFRDKSASQRAMQELQNEGSIRFENLPLQDRNGHCHPVEVVANLYQEGSQAVIQCNIRDIGQRVQFEREREVLLASEQAARVEADAANRAKDLFLATLSHEVRTPLNAILGWATILRTGECDTADLREGMEVIERNCRVQAQLIDDVLDVSRIVSGNLRLHIGRCELAGVISAAIDSVKPAADAKGLHIESALDLDPGVVWCDANRMQQVICNLLTNAIKFTSTGGKVRITLDRAGSATRIRVADEGQGISAEFLPFVFDRFRQADSSTQRKAGGLGLGLSIVKRLVEMHGGTVQAESAGEGRGATFTVLLPVRAFKAGEGGADGLGKSIETLHRDVLPIRLDALRILVVDDEADSRRVLVKVLLDAGAVVTAAASAAEAMASLEAAAPQVLVSDIAMPG
jgi:PAS domain S-box-containing protein